MSLNMLSSKPAVMDHTAAAVAVTADPQLKFASSTLDTNLHKILARRLAGGQPVSYDSCKLLTKAYYKLLRDPAITGVTSTVQPQKLYTHNCSDNSILNWQSLVKTDTQQVILLKTIDQLLISIFFSAKEYCCWLFRVGEVTQRSANAGADDQRWIVGRTGQNVGQYQWNDWQFAVICTDLWSNAFSRVSNRDVTFDDK